MKILHIDHVGIVVHNLAEAKAFFIDLGFRVLGETPIKGRWLDAIIGLNDVRSDIVMLRAPDGQLNLELTRFHQPMDTEGIRSTAANTLGLRHIAFQVDDVEAVVQTLKQKGRELVGSIQVYENAWELCYIRGPEGILIELAEQLSVS